MTLYGILHKSGLHVLDQTGHWAAKSEYADPLCFESATGSALYVISHGMSYHAEWCVLQGGK